MALMATSVAWLHEQDPGLSPAFLGRSDAFEGSTGTQTAMRGFLGGLQRMGCWVRNRELLLSSTAQNSTSPTPIALSLPCCCLHQLSVHKVPVTTFCAYTVGFIGPDILWALGKNSASAT